MTAEQRDQRVDPAVQALRGCAAERERTRQRGIERVENTRDDGGVQLRLAAKMMEEGRLAEPDTLRDLAETDPGKAALGKQSFCRIQDLVAGGELDDVGAFHDRPMSHSLPNDRSVSQ